MGASVNQNLSGNVTINLDPFATVTFQWAPGVTATLVRGTTDTDRTGFILRNASGTACFCYPNDAGNAWVVNTTGF